MGEASCRYLMSSVLARETGIAEAEEAMLKHMAAAKAIDAELKAIPKPTQLPAGATKLLAADGGGGAPQTVEMAR